MKIQRIVYTPKIIAEFTEEEISVLKFLSEGHYDWACKSLSKPGRGAIINGLVNSITDGKAEWTLTNGETQLLCKCCEMATLCEPKIAEVGVRLHSELWRAITRLGEEWDKLNDEGKLWV